MRVYPILGMTIVLSASPVAASPATPNSAAWANRLTWGTSAAPDQGPSPSSDQWLDQQLTHPQDVLPSGPATLISTMQISQRPMAELVVDGDAAIRYANKLPDTTQRDAARKAYQQYMNALANEAATRSVLRDIYAPDQLREQMTWFWFNHFNVQAQKRDIRAMVGDYEDRLRDHSLGRFRDLLEATLKHPAMLRYLDNDQNAANHINENYAREIMELHSMGVGSGYTQQDVQQLARILTGVGVNLSHDAPKLNPQRQPLYLRAGLFEFNPNRHDFGDKRFLGHTIKGSGFGEVEEALDLIARSPATAHHVSSQIATYFMDDNPPTALIERMTSTWQRTDGDISAVLRTMIRAPEFRQSLGNAFKDPVHYVISAVRVTYGDQDIKNVQPVLGWLNRMGEGLYAHETPDGYQMNSAAWTGPGQMSVRFEIARQIGGGAAALFRSAPPPAGVNMMTGQPIASISDATPTVPAAAALPAPPLPQLQKAAYYVAVAPMLNQQTQSALSQATSPQEWNALFLSSPEFMRR
ncbi:MAG: DUF1800 domain-containing protein [Sphingomonas sp.]